VRRSAIVVALLTTTIACKRHQEAAPSSIATTAPSSVVSAEAIAPAPESAMPTESASTAPSASTHVDDGEALLRAFGGGRMLDVDASLEGASGPGTMPSRATRLGAGNLRAATVRMGAVTVIGRLPKEVVQRIVRQRFGALRICYEAGLALNPALTGRVTTRFTIAADGTVAAAQDGGSDLADANAVQCVVRQFGRMEFPKPEGGIVIVTVPLTFSAPPP
jgi:hypothetical protein